MATRRNSFCYNAGMPATGNSRWIAGELFSVLSRVVPAVFFALSCYGFWISFLQTGKWTSLLWMISEGMVILLMVFRRESSKVSRRPWDWFVGLGGAFCVLLVRPRGSVPLLPDAIGAAFQVAGTIFELYGKVALGRSFGIVPANRGVVVEGPYCLVRHPIYLGYLVTHLGFLATNWSTYNAAIYVATYFFQVARILSEERVLKESGEYRDYCSRVPYRLIPGLF